MTKSSRQQTRMWKKTLMSAAAAAMLFSAFPEAAVQADAVQDTKAFAGVLEKTTSSVVAIIGKPGDSKRVWQANRYTLSHGTGVIVKSEGYILTNAHVVKDMRNITVVTADGKSYTGKTTHYDEESDLALIKIDATGLTPAVFASPKDIRVGESVMAIGTPLYFALRNSVTYGIVSGMDRSVQSSYQLIQTDAAINPGNSGGALVNMNGQVIGINTMKFVDFGVDNLGFAIPVGTVQHVLDHFFKFGKVKRVTLGLELGESWEALVGLPTASGLEVTYVEADSPAGKAGIKKGDVLLSIDSSKVSNLVEYNEVLKKYLPEQKVKVQLQSQGKAKEVELVLAEARSTGATVVQSEDGTYIDSDQGKTKIGDSYYGWSMQYPAGLVEEDQSSDGDNVTFADAKGEFAINILVQEQLGQELSPAALVRKLGRSSGDTILEKRYDADAAVPYAKLIGKRESGSHYEVRIFQKNQKLYTVSLAVMKEEHYTSPAKRNSYYDLLDSFTFSFDQNDSALKDISVYQKKNTITSEYGIAFELPTEWSKERYGRRNVFYDKDQEVSMTFRVSSASSGDTLKAWADRQEREITDSYVEGYRESKGAQETVVGGVPALENHYATTMGDKWRETHSIYILKDKYKYELTWSYPREKAGEETDAVIEEIKQTIAFPKEAMYRGIGFIQDDEDLVDPNAKVPYENKKYRYKLSVPELWSNGYGGYDDFDDYDDFSSYSYGSVKDTPMKMLSFEGGSLMVRADDLTNLEDTLNRLDKSYKENAERDANYKYSVTEEALAGVTAKKYEVQYKRRNVPYTQLEYVLERGGIVYTVRAEINDAVKTDAQWTRLLETIQSLELTEK
jgi:serine protease Do